MYAIAAAARRQIRLRIPAQGEQRRDHRQPEEQHERDGQDASHGSILAQTACCHTPQRASYCFLPCNICLTRSNIPGFAIAAEGLAAVPPGGASSSFFGALAALSFSA